MYLLWYRYKTRPFERIRDELRAFFDVHAEVEEIIYKHKITYTHTFIHTYIHTYIQSRLCLIDFSDGHSSWRSASGNDGRECYRVHRGKYRCNIFPSSVCMYVCMYLSLYVYMYVYKCMYISVCIYNVNVTLMNVKILSRLKTWERVTTPHATPD